MATPPSLLCHRDNAVLRAWNRTPNKEQVALGVHPHDPKADFSVAFRAHVAGHPLSLNDSGGIGAWTDGARLAMAGIAVGCRTAAEAVAMDHTLKSTPLRRAGHLDQLAGSKDVDLHFGTSGGRLAIDREAPKHLWRSAQSG